MITENALHMNIIYEVITESLMVTRAMLGVNGCG